MAINSNLFNMLFSGLATDNNVNAMPQRQKAMDTSLMRSRALQDQLRQQQIKQNEYNLGRMGQNTTTVQKTPEGFYEITQDPQGRVVSANPVRQGQATRGVGNAQVPTGGVLRPDQVDRPIVGRPAPQKMSALQEKISIAAGKPFDQMTPAERQQAFKKLPSSGTTVNVSPSNTLADLNNKMLEGLVTESQGAGNRLRKAEQGLELLRARMQSGNETGKWAPVQTEVAAYLGVDPEGVANAQAFDVAMGDYVMGRIQETKGAVSEKEMSYFDKISPSSSKEPFTNFALLEIARRQAFRERDKMKYLDEFLNQGGKAWQFDDWYMENHDPFPEFSIDQLRDQFKNEFGSTTNLPPGVRSIRIKG